MPKTLTTKRRAHTKRKLKSFLRATKKKKLRSRLKAEGRLDAYDKALLKSRTIKQALAKVNSDGTLNQG